MRQSSCYAGAGNKDKRVRHSKALLLLRVAATTMVVSTCTGENSSTPTVPTAPGMAALTWNPVTVENLSGYRVYYGTKPGAYIQGNGQGLNAGKNTYFLVLGLNGATRYNFAVTAYDSTNVESGFSNEVFKEIP